MDQSQLQTLLRNNYTQQEKYITYKYPIDLKQNIVQKLENLRKEVQQEQISFRKWLTVKVILSEQNQLKQQPCALFNSQNQIIQLNKQALDLGVKVGMELQYIKQFYPNLNILRVSSQSQIQEVYNQIIRYLQQFDKDVEIDYTLNIFQLDITNYLSEKGQDQPLDTCIQIQRQLLEQFKVNSYLGISMNSFLSHFGQVKATENQRLIEIKDFSSHLDFEIDQYPNFSKSFVASLNLMEIYKIKDIDLKLMDIYQVFPHHIVQSLLRLFYGVGKSYHNISNDIDTIKVSRVLKLGEYSLRQLQSQIEQIADQIIFDMKHYQKIGKIVKLQLTKIDHTHIQAKREFQRIESDYFQQFKTECYQMLKQLNVQNLLLQKITIQTFELKPLKSIEFSDTSFDQRFYKSLEQQKELKRYSFPTNKDNKNQTLINKTNEQKQNSINSNIQNQYKQPQNNIINTNLEILEQKNITPETNILNNIPQNLNFQQNQIKSHQFIQQNQNSNQQKQNELQNLQINIINESSLQSNPSIQQPKRMNEQEIQLNVVPEQTNNQNKLQNDRKQELNQDQITQLTINKPQINNNNWLPNRMTPVSEGCESEKQSSAQTDNSNLKFQQSNLQNFTKSSTNYNRDSFLPNFQNQKNVRTSLQDIKLNLSNVYASFEFSDQFNNISNKEHTLDENQNIFTNQPIEDKKRKSSIIPDSIMEDEEVDFSQNVGIFKEIPQKIDKNINNISKQISELNQICKQINDVNYSKSEQIQEKQQSSTMSSFQNNESKQISDLNQISQQIYEVKDQMVKQRKETQQISIMSTIQNKQSKQISDFNEISRQIYEINDSKSEQRKETQQSSMMSINQNKQNSNKEIPSRKNSNLSEFNDDKMIDMNSEGSEQSRFEQNSNLLNQKKQYLNEKFTCPLCGNQIDCKGNYSYINNHIDMCLEKQSDEEQKQQDFENILQGKTNFINQQNNPSNSTPVELNSNRRKCNDMIEIPNQSASLQKKRGRPLGSKNSKTLNLNQKVNVQTNNLFGFGFKNDKTNNI